MSIKMIVTDLDSTLLRSNRTISEYTVSILKARFKYYSSLDCLDSRNGGNTETVIAEIENSRVSRTADVVI